MSRIDVLIDGLLVRLAEYKSRSLLKDDDLEKHWHELQTPFLRTMWFDSEHVVKDFLISLQDTAIVGEAQSGKSSVLGMACLISALSFRDGDHSFLPLHVDLGLELGTDLDVKTYLTELKEDVGDIPVRLFIDSVDEPVRVKGRRFLKDLASGLKRSFPNAPLVIASRRWALGPQELHALRPPLRVLTTDLIHQGFYHQFLQTREDFDAFISEVYRLGLTHFLGRALDGIGLVKEFRANGKLPATRAALFQIRLQAALKAASSTPGLGSKPSTYALERLAQSLAVVATLSGQVSWSEEEARSSLEQLCQGEVQEGQLLTLLGTSLFKSSSGGRYAFARDEDRERLAAFALQGLSMRKLRMVVGLGPEGVAPAYRGLAQNLASQSEQFFRELQRCDPVAAVFTEQVDSRNGDRLLQYFFEFVTGQNVVPWQKLPPSDEELQVVLYFRRPSNADEFLKPWLEHAQNVARLWATLAAKIWGVTFRSNPALLSIALDANRSTGRGREYAVQAIGATEDRKALLKLGLLHRSTDSEARANYIEAVLRQRSPGARRIVGLFRGGRREALVGKMVGLAQEAASYLPSSEVDLAFRLVIKYRPDFDDLAEQLISGILGRAARDSVELDLASLASAFKDHPQHRIKTDDVLSYISAEPMRLRRFVCFILMLPRAKYGLAISIWNALGQLARINPNILLPSIPDNVFSIERRRLSELFRDHLRHFPTREVKATIESRFNIDLPSLERDAGNGPASTYFDSVVQDLRERVQPDSPDNIRWLAVNLHWHLSHRRMADFPAQDLSEGNQEYVRDILYQFWQTHVLDTLVVKDDGSWTEVRYGHARQQELFIFALSTGVRLTTEQLAQYFLVYGFGSEPSSLAAIRAAAEALRQNDPSAWGNAVQVALKGHRPGGTIQYLTELKSAVFADEARCLLSAPQLARSDDLYLIELYFRALDQPDLPEVLFGFYRGLRSDRLRAGHEEFSSRILLELCDGNRPEAWEELKFRLHAQDFPLVSSRRRSLPTPPSYEIAQSFVPWFAHSATIRPAPGDWNELPPMILRAVQGGSRVTAISLLRKMRDSTSEEWARLSASRFLFETTYGRSEDAPEAFRVEELRRLLNVETDFAVVNEHGLFESILEAFDKEIDHYRAGEGVEGFWNHGEGGDNRVRKTPKNERLCQNSLWKNLRTRLEAMGITGVKEKIIRDGFADFWCELTVAGRAPMKVPVELKVTGYRRGKPWLVDSMEKQLLELYMMPSGCRFGIFVVLWFQSAVWPHPAKTWTIEKLAESQRALASRLAEEHCVRIEPLIIDVTAPSSDSLKFDSETPRIGTGRADTRSHSKSKSKTASKPRAGAKKSSTKIRKATKTKTKTKANSQINGAKPRRGRGAAVERKGSSEVVP